MAKGAPAKGSKPTKRAANQQRSLRRNRDEESHSMLRYEGGMMEAKDKKSEDNDDDGTHCCCASSKAIMIYAGVLMILAVFMILNICLVFGNKYFPTYYPLVSLFIVILLVAGLVLIGVWMCGGTHSLLLPGAWIVFGATIALLLWNIFFILNFNKKSKDPKPIKVGTGDDDDNYDGMSRGEYILSYIIGGAIILTFSILLICVTMSYLKTIPDEEEEKMEKKDDMMMMEEEKPMMEDMAAEVAEGGQLEKQSNFSKSSARKSQSQRSYGRTPAGPQSSAPAPAPVKSIAAPAPAPAAPISAPSSPQPQEEAAAKETRAAAYEIDADDTPRQSLQAELPYEIGIGTTTVQFNEHLAYQQPQAEQTQQPGKQQKKKKQRKQKQN